jgi:hypothetical protein
MEVADKIRKAVPEDLPRIGSALGRAFFDDPLFVWAIQEDDRRERFELEFFTLYAKAFLHHDETYTSGGEVVAAALWAPPGAEPVSGEDAEELGRLVEELAGPEGSRFLDLTKLFDDHHPHGSYCCGRLHCRPHRRPGRRTRGHNRERRDGGLLALQH